MNYRRITVKIERSSRNVGQVASCSALEDNVLYVELP